MARHGKKFSAAAAKVADRDYSIEEAIPLIQTVKYAKFDETVEVAMRLGVDPKHADQMVRGTVVLPHGLGKSKRVLAIAGADNCGALPPLGQAGSFVQAADESATTTAAQTNRADERFLTGISPPADVSVRSMPVWLAKLGAGIAGWRRRGGMTPTVIEVITSNEAVHENADVQLGITLSPLSATLEKLVPTRAGM